MSRTLAAALIGAALMTQAALASDSFADAGRYQVIPKVLVPNQAGKNREQPILLDTETGRTWRLAKDAKKEGKSSGARWVPLDTEFAERLEAENASRGPGKEVANRGVLDSDPNYFSRKRRLDEHYDDDP